MKKEKTGMRQARLHSSFNSLPILCFDTKSQNKWSSRKGRNTTSTHQRVAAVSTASHHFDLFPTPPSWPHKQQAFESLAHLLPSGVRYQDPHQTLRVSTEPCVILTNCFPTRLHSRQPSISIQILILSHQRLF